jgi:4-amino-4-deoxy-L-arabinose transferase-like glycosyltransferase
MYDQGRSDLPDWQRKFAVEQWKSKAQIEPEIVERLAALTYRFTGEQLWIGRIYSSLFWLVGGVFLFVLARDLSSATGALFALAFYLFLPYAVIASRSFQPDPLMVTFIIAFWWAVNRWSTSLDAQGASTSDSFSRGELGRAVLAGLLGGLAILVKFTAAFFVIGGGLGLILGREPLPRALRRPGVWVMVVIGALPGLIYLVYGTLITGFLDRQFGGRFIPSLLLSPSYYLNWLSTLDHVLGLGILALALLGIFLFRERPARVFVIGLWAAYLVYGLYFDYHIWSHDYYNLPLIPLAAISLAPIADRLGAELGGAAAGSRFARFAIPAVLALGLFAVLWNVRTTLKSVDYRPEAAMWAEIGQVLGPGARVVALTQDYGSRLAYWGWLDAAAWPLAGDIAYHSGLLGARNDFEQRFDQLAAGRDYFLVTLPDELRAQPLLAERLASYPIYRQGDGYVIYDLRNGGPI